MVASGVAELLCRLQIPTADLEHLVVFIETPPHRRDGAAAFMKPHLMDGGGRVGSRDSSDIRGANRARVPLESRRRAQLGLRLTVPLSSPMIDTPATMCMNMRVALVAPSVAVRLSGSPNESSRTTP